MAKSLVHSPVDYRIKTKNAFMRMKNCSPKFKTILRQRYKERVENSRMKLLNSFRQIDVGHDVISNSDIEDWHYLDSAISKPPALEEIFKSNPNFDLDEELLHEEDLQKELTQFENWLLQEYESMWSEEDNDEVVVTCPLCCSGYFEYPPSCNHVIFCRKCNSSFATQRSMLDIQNDIFNEVDKHKVQCCSFPSFINLPGDEFSNNLCIVCDVCAYLQVII